ncbi:S1C family serine protease [Gracilinema caldarium]|uniref:S1C family serine protease n=1 Tax=Gracilinema caldarium TaxID=215591 RepID=UPI0026EA3B49|nr:S1C family serine protease [Gracilinema caldarium]
MSLKKIGWRLFPLLVFLFVSCVSASHRLEPPRFAMELRFSDLERLTEAEPTQAIHAIQVFKERYPALDAQQTEQLDTLYQRACKTIIAKTHEAIDAKQWTKARSLLRSLFVLDLAQEFPEISEGKILMLQAEDFLSGGKDLEAFLALLQAAQSGFDVYADRALPFFKRAIELNLRPLALYIYQLALQSDSRVQDSEKSYLRGRDSTAEMIRGVATVLVDRGIRIEKGRSYADRVLGSAFFIDKSGLLITNYHVIASEVDPKYNGISRMFIRMGDASSPKIPAKVIGWDPIMDLAVIKAEIVPEYVFSVIGSDTAQVGEKVYAIGSPAGLEKTVTSGIISALNRRLLQLGDVIQLDAAVNHGNSGGPVVNEQGNLLGVVFAGIEQFQGINFAVPVQRLVSALPALLAGGEVERPWLGLVLSEDRYGVNVLYVAPNTPAFEQNIPVESTLKRLNGKALSDFHGNSIAALQDQLLLCQSGELVSLETTDGRQRLLALAKRPIKPLIDAIKLDTKERLTAPLFGMLLSPGFGSAIAPQYQIKKIVRGSIADESGLSENDPLIIQGFSVDEKQGLVSLDISIKKRKMGYLEVMMRLYGSLEITDTL